MAGTPARSRRISLALLHALGWGSIVSLAQAEPPAGAPAAATTPPEPTGSPPALPPVENDLPPEYPPSSTRVTHVVAGAATTAVWYGIAAGTSLLWPDAPGSDELLIPVAGPWMSLAETGCPADEPDCSTVVVVLQAILTTLSGVGQAGGLAIMGEGLLIPTSAERTASKRAPLEVSAQVQPFTRGNDTVGLGVVGTF